MLFLPAVATYNRGCHFLLCQDTSIKDTAEESAKIDVDQDQVHLRFKQFWPLFQFGSVSEKKVGGFDSLAMTFSMSELNRTTKLLIETDEEDPDAPPQKSAKEIEEEKKAEKDAQQKMVSLLQYFSAHFKGCNTILTRRHTRYLYLKIYFASYISF